MFDGIRPVLLAALLALAPASAMAQSARAPVVAAANNLQFAIEELAEAFRQETGQAVRLAMGSSGNASRQIRQGAPFELFLSADEEIGRASCRERVLDGV